MIQLRFLLRYLSRGCEVLAVGRAPTIFQNEWFCTRISNFFQSPIFSIARSVNHRLTRTWSVPLSLIRTCTGLCLFPL